MCSLKHLFWVHHWQLVGSAHPPGGLAYFSKKKNKNIWKSLSSCVCKWTTKLWCNCGHAWLFMHAETCQSCATAEPRWGPGQEPWSTAAWQAALALGWPLPPPGCPHSLTSLAWQQQPNKLRAPQSSHRSMGMFFTAPTPLFMVIMVCVLYTNTPTCQLKSTKAGVHLGVWRNIKSLHVLYIYLAADPCTWWM